MKHVHLKDKKAVANQAVVHEEKRGYAADLLPKNTTFLTDAVRQKIQKLSVLEVIT